MSTTETEYYWDEATQLYYYWDEATQAYYPWEESTGAEAAPDGGASVDTSVQEPETDKKKQSYTLTTARADEKLQSSWNKSDATTPEAMDITPASSQLPSSNASPQPDQKRGTRRGMTRHITLADHGGLEGVLQIIKDEREGRVTSREINEIITWKTVIIIVVVIVICIRD